MSYSEKEYSLSDGTPVELFLFEDDIALNNWAFTTGDSQLVDGSITYLPDIISRTSVSQKAGETPGAIEIAIPGNSNLASQFIEYLPARPISLRVFRYHRTDAGEEKRVVFIGRAASISFDDEGAVASIACYPVTKSSGRTVPWQIYKGGCNWALYGVGCGVLESSFELDSPSILAVNGDQIQAAEFSTFDDRWFANGYLRVVSTGEVRFITDHVGDTITLVYPISGLGVGDAIKVYPGCDRTAQTCRDKFNNIANYLGWDYIPSDSPFEDSLDGTPSNSGPVKPVTPFGGIGNIKD